MFMHKSKAFTLIELMIVVAIVAILAAVAYPSYTNYVMRTRRADARELLMRMAAAEERFYTNRNVYTATLADLGFSSADSEGGYYTITPALGNGGQTYTLTAAPQGAQSSDKCANLVLNSTGGKTMSGAETNGKCW